MHRAHCLAHHRAAGLESDARERHITASFMSQAPLLIHTYRLHTVNTDAAHTPTNINNDLTEIDQLSMNINGQCGEDGRMHQTWPASSAVITSIRLSDKVIYLAFLICPNYYSHEHSFSHPCAAALWSPAERCNSRTVKKVKHIRVHWYCALGGLNSTNLLIYVTNEESTSRLFSNCHTQQATP